MAIPEGETTDGALKLDHVRVGLEPELGYRPRPLDHPCKACGGERCTPLRSEHEGRLRLLLALEPPQGAQLVPEDRVRAGSAGSVPMVDVTPTAHIGQQPWGFMAEPPTRKPTAAGGALVVVAVLFEFCHNPRVGER
jgi:hypothetical protein